jgi:hypothetical protein
MWDAGLGICVGCGHEADRDILGRCDSCFRQGVCAYTPYFKEMGTANPLDPKGSTAHVRDIQDRRWHPTEKRMFYYSKEKPKTYFLPKG